MNKNILSTVVVATILATVLGVVTLVVISKIVGPLPLNVNQTVTHKQTTFDAQGNAERSVVPDVAHVSLGISIRQDSVQNAQTQANEVITKIQDQLASLNIAKEDIRTENYSVNPIYDYSDANQRVLGYTVSSNVRVTVRDFQNVNAVIDRGTQAGANQVGGINFTLSEQAEEDLKKELRQEAIDKAKENAEELASLAGMKLGRIVNIYEQPQPNYPGPMYNRALMDGAGGAMELSESTSIEPGSTKYSFMVTLSYETL